MSKVTALTIQKRNKERVNIFLDDEYAFSLSILLASRLRKGQVLSDANIAELRGEDEYERAKESALNFLTYRPRSGQEIERKLKEKQYSPIAIERTIDRLTELGYIDDRTFAKYWLDQRNHFKPRSRFALMQELSFKGVDREIVDEVLSDVDELDAAKRAAQKKLSRFRTLPKDEFRKKLAGFLQRRGFGYEIVNEVIADCWRQITHEEN